MILAALTAGVMIGAALAVRAVGDAILADLEDQLDTTRERVIADLRRPVKADPPRSGDMSPIVWRPALGPLWTLHEIEE